MSWNKLKMILVVVFVFYAGSTGSGWVAHRTLAGPADTEGSQAQAPDPGKEVKDKEEVKPVRVNGVEFLLVADPQVKTPLPGGKQAIKLELKITNVTRKDFFFRGRNLDECRRVLTEEDGKAIRDMFYQSAAAVAAVQVPAGKSKVIDLGAILDWQDGKLHLTSGDNRRGFWECTGLKPGRYRLRIEYDAGRGGSLPGGGEYWTGKVTTNSVPFEIVENPK